MAAPWSLKRSFSSFSCGTCVRCSALRRRAQPSNKEGLEDPTLETPLKDTGLPPSPPAPPIDGRTLFDLEVEEEDNEIARRSIVERLFKNVSWDTIGEDARANLYYYALDYGLLAETLEVADKTTTDKTSPILNDLGPVALPRIGKKERFSKPCPRHREAGRRAGPHQYLSKPFHCGCCVGTCELCDPTKDLSSPSFSLTPDSDLAFGADPFGDGAASEDLPQPESQPDSEGEPFHCELYPHCGCDPAKDRVAMLDTPFAMRE